MTPARVNLAKAFDYYTVIVMAHRSAVPLVCWTDFPSKTPCWERWGPSKAPMSPGSRAVCDNSASSFARWLAYTTAAHTTKWGTSWTASRFKGKAVHSYYPDGWSHDSPLRHNCPAYWHVLYSHSALKMKMLLRGALGSVYIKKLFLAAFPGHRSAIQREKLQMYLCWHKCW